MAEEAQFQEGFSLKTVVGAFFITLFMLPGGMYLGLVAGQGVGEAAEWVTIVLFAEVARRSYNPLRKQEIYVLFYVATALTTAVSLERGLGGGPFSTLIWNAYFAASPAASRFAAQIPTWAVPSPDSPAMLHRELWHHAWWIPVGLLVLTELMGRLSWIGLGYVLFRITSDVEKLPFPYAPVAASGATALSEAGTESWRWNVFSTGAVVGLLFGLFYIAVPVVTGTILGHSVQILPIPFADWTRSVEAVLPAAVVGLSLSLGNVFIGFVLPFDMVAGACVASVLAMVVGNPILYHFGLLPSYRLGSDAVLTKLTVDMDFWLSIGIGINLSIALIGVGLVASMFREAARNRNPLLGSGARKFAPPPGRGDIPILLALLGWLFASVSLIVVCHLLVPAFPIWLLIFFGLVWSPLNSYISARMIGLTGRGVSFPYLKEASVVATGYRRVDVWYAPIPVADYGWAAQRFREVELTGTKFTSIFKAEALMFPLIIVASFLFWAFFWNSSPLPNAQFPYAQKFWPIQSASQAAIMQINSGQGGWFARAIDPGRIAIGTGAGLALYGGFAIFRLPLMFFYGFAGGIGLYPAITVPQFLGAWFGRRVMARRYGAEQWSRYAPVLLAGFACGTGLVSMASIALALIAKAVSKLPY